MLDRLTGRWTGLALSVLVVIGTLWLAVTGDLDLYVHPRYIPFTVTMGVLGGATSVAALLFLPSHEQTREAHDAEEATAQAHVQRHPFVRVTGRLLVLAAATVGILVLPPSTLTAAIAGTREVNAASAIEAPPEGAELAGSDGSSLTIKDWAALLRQGLPDQFRGGTDVALTGFVLPTESDDTFYLARYLITHCAIDAQPVGVPVHWPGWREQLDAENWLSIGGTFESNPSDTLDAPVVLVPTSSEPVEEPDDPYVY